MATEYNYPIWDGKTIIGYYNSSSQLFGNFIEIFEVSPFKQKYKVKPKTIKIPIITSIVENTGVRITMEFRLDVRRKSQRQINIILGH